MTDREQTEKTGSAKLDLALLDASTAFALARGLSDLLDAVNKAIRLPTDFDIGGLGIYEARRRVMIVYAARDSVTAGRPGERQPLSADGEEFSLEETEAADFLAHPATYTSPDIGSQQQLPIHKRLGLAGVRRYLSIPLLYDEHLLGALYAFALDPVSPLQPTLDYLRRLGTLLTPALWNHLTQDRLAKGDRRRATLVELSDAINTSLDLELILRTARQAVGQIEGHKLSMIGLLAEDGKVLRAYWHPPLRGGKRTSAAGPEELSIATTPLPWVLEHRKTYESEDLGENRFEIDQALSRAGVRRYVVAPMFVRGRIIGGFLFGTTDAHPALTTDVWLYENIAMQLALAIDNARQFEQLKGLSDRLAQENVYLREEIETDYKIEGMIGSSPAMLYVLEAIARVAGTDAAVLITGPTGVGKELVARAIHAQSNRASHSMVKVNCAAIPENLVESELFGHEKGAFTSAIARNIGRFELARNGSLFLDEAGELPLAIQAKLLRVLQDGEFERVGGTTTIKTDARIIAATNRDLLRSIAEGTFRSDLYYRLNVFPIEVPPLSDRREDIPLLVDSFIGQLNRQMGKNVESIDAGSLRHLCDRDWPGNIRELRHVIERGMILCDGHRLTIQTGGPPQTRVSLPPVQTAQPPVMRPGSIITQEPSAAVGTLQDMERDHVTRALQQTGGVIDGPRGAAALLGLKPSTLRSRMKRLGVNRLQ